MKKEKNNNIRNEDSRAFAGIICRYGLAFILGICLWIFYYLFTPLTFYPAAFILGFFAYVQYELPYMLIFGYKIKIVEACIAGSAYYLLFLLNFLTPRIRIKKRILLLLFTFSVFYIANLLRIVFLVLIYTNSFSFFNVAHKILWYGLSTLFVVLIWLYTVKIFKIKEIPAYSDYKFLLKLAGRKKK